MATTESTSNAVPATPGPASSPAPAQPPMGGLTGDFTWTTEVDRRRGLIGLLMMHGQGNHLQITPQGWQGLFDASAPFGYRLIGAIEFHQADAAQPWDQHHMGRLARQARTRDVVLTDNVVKSLGSVFTGKNRVTHRNNYGIAGGRLPIADCD